VKDTAYQREKLAQMNRENTAEIIAMKGLTATAKAEDWPALKRRALKLERAVKAAARLERELERSKVKDASAS